MKLRALLSGSWVIVVSLASFSCSTQEIAEYPPEWPRRLVEQTCSALSGRYRNESVATTLWRAPHNPRGTRAFLGDLMRDGLEGSMDPLQESISAMDIEVKTRTLQAVRGEGVTLASDRSQLPAEWICLESGKLGALFEHDAPDEYSVARRAKLKLTLELASDGSLIVRRIEQFHGGFPPTRDRVENWMLFERISKFVP